MFNIGYTRDSDGTVVSPLTESTWCTCMIHRIPYPIFSFFLPIYLCTSHQTLIDTSSHLIYARFPI